MPDSNCRSLVRYTSEPPHLTRGTTSHRSHHISQEGTSDISQEPPHLTRATTSHRSHHISQEVPHLTGATASRRSHRISQEPPHLTRATTYHKSHHILQEPPHLTRTTILPTKIFFYEYISSFDLTLLYFPELIINM